MEKLKPFRPDTIVSWGNPPIIASDGYYNPTELVVEPYKYRVIVSANPAQILCPVHVK